MGLLGLGAYVPERVMPNAEWAEHVDTSDEWIRERTGIERRRIAAEGESTADLATEAASRALADAGLAPAEVGEIILATDSPEVPSPDTAAIVQHRLGAGPVPTYDLAGSGCAGFLLGLDLARSRVLAGRRNVLVIGVEVLSKIMSWRDRSTCVLFGDGAGAAVVSRGPAVAPILGVVAGTDGGRAGILGKEVGGTRSPFSREELEAGRHDRLTMDGQEVYRAAVTHMGAAAREVLALTGHRLEDVSLFVPHQANLRIIRTVARNLELPDSRVFVNLQEYGNTGSASIPLSLWEARRTGRLAEGDLALLTAFGAGFHWAAALVRF